MDGKCASIYKYDDVCGKHWYCCFGVFVLQTKTKRYSSKSYTRNNNGLP